MGRAEEQSCVKEGSTKTAAGRLPGDLTKDELIERIIRVDHAGEFGAKRIYEGQLAVLRGKPEAQAIEHMYQQELEHLRTFEKLMVERRVRPSALHPLWNAAGFALGAQSDRLGADEAPLKAKIDKFRAEELQHRDAGLAHGAEQAPAYPLLTGAIKAGSRLAIWLAERI
jgi:ubiquinone biosynthesis monooxygenase Coq7